MLAESKQQTLLMQFLMNKNWSFARHLILLLPLASTFIPNADSEAAKAIPNYDEVMQAVYSHGIFMFCLSVSLIYFNLFVLLPRLLFRNRYLLYAFGVAALGIIYFIGEYIHGNYAYQGFEKQIEVPVLSFKNFVDNVLLPLIFLGATAGYKVFKKWIVDTQRLNDLQKAQLNEELIHLKNQVNPHFLFNTLNNLQTLVKTDADKASQVILGLSDVLRYQLYDSTKENVLLSKDIEMISHYLLLEKIRRENFTYEIKINGDINGLLIPPLLFINFIENALKHGADTREASFLSIEFILLENSRLQFIAKNSKPSIISIKPQGGLGLKNINRRLELLYANNFDIDISDRPNLYSVTLTIPI
ncbi:MAG: histidine kinase [Gloeobacteraceae cyanobacterium ES-bin-316]|nr:histidine kinase [Ferruginibacter sp.]